MTNSHQDNVANQFGPRAEAYVNSAVHSEGADLELLENIVRGRRPRNALDLGSGGGHVAYRLAHHAGNVAAVDPSPEMLAAVAATAHEKVLTNIGTHVASAESLPFANEFFDFVGCRFSAHHWHDFEAGLRETRRVMSPGSTAVFIDAVSPGAALLDTHIQTVELLRDTSHVRDYTVAEWMAALSRANFTVSALHTWQLRMDFSTWVARMQTPALNANAIRALQQSASADVASHFAIEPDGSFMLDTVLLQAVAI